MNSFLLETVFKLYPTTVGSAGKAKGGNPLVYNKGTVKFKNTSSYWSVLPKIKPHESQHKIGKRPKGSLAIQPAFLQEVRDHLQSKVDLQLEKVENRGL